VRELKSLISGLLFGLFLIGCVDAIEISSCGTLNVTDTYVLSTNIVSNGTCFVIAADDIILNCNGYVIEGNGAGSGVYASKIENLVVKRCDITNFSIGISLYECYNCTLMGNNVFRNIYDGIYHRSAHKGRGYYTRISHNDIWENGRHGIYLYMVWRNRIENNRIFDNMGNGVNMKDGWLTKYLYPVHSGLHVIKDNMIFNNSNGVYLGRYSLRNIVHGNIVVANRYNGVRVGGGLSNSIRNNRILHNMRGVFIHLKESIAFRNAVVNNVIMNNRKEGVYAWAACSNYINYNNISTNGGVGIGLSYCPWIYPNDFTSYVKGNYIFNNSGGIYQYYTRKYGVRALNNKILNNKGYGIFLYHYVMNARIGSNRISGHAFGIKLAGYGTYATIENNTISDNGYGIYMNGIDFGSTIVYHNNIFDSSVYEVWANKPIELSHNNEGNFWGHTKPPLFEAGVDSNRLDVVDSHPYCVESGWLLGYSPGQCELMDEDGDGVLDQDDMCPSTPPGVIVASNGCQYPVADADGPYEGDECSSIVFNASLSYDPDGTIILYEWDWDNDGVYDENTTSPIITHSWCDDHVGGIGLRVTDNTSLIATANTTVTVFNVKPVVEAGPDLTGEEGEDMSLVITFTDPGLQDTHTAKITWCDGTETSLAESEIHYSRLDGLVGVINVTHTYCDNGNYTVLVSVTDDDGGTGADDLTLTILNVAPVVEAGPDQEVTAGDNVSFSGRFIDPGECDTHTIKWDFGDGTVAWDTLTPTHVYYDKGNYTVILTITDDDGGVGVDDLMVIVNPIQATVDIDPNRLNLRSRGKWIAAYIELPPDYNVSLIDVNTVYLIYGIHEFPAINDTKYEFVTDPEEYLTDKDGDGIIERMVKFAWTGLQKVLEVGEAELRVEGKVYYNQGWADFEGSDVVRVI
jgi:parallel beta-helix repeat protein